MLEDEAVDLNALAINVPNLAHRQRGFSQRPHMTSSPGNLMRLQHFAQLHVWGHWQDVALRHLSEMVTG